MENTHHQRWLLRSHGVWKISSLSQTKYFKIHFLSLLFFCEKVSDPITSLQSFPNGPFETDDQYKAYVLLTWFSPCVTNGDIEYFLLEFKGSRANHDPLNFQRQFIAKFTKNGFFTYNETNLMPEYSYNVSVSVKTYGVDTLSSAIKGKFESPAGSKIFLCIS